MGGWAMKFRRPERHAWLIAKRKGRVQPISKCGRHRGLGGRESNLDYYSTLSYTETRFLGGNLPFFDDVSVLVGVGWKV